MKNYFLFALILCTGLTASADQNNLVIPEKLFEATHRESKINNTGTKTEARVRKEGFDTHVAEYIKQCAKHPELKTMTFDADQYKEVLFGVIRQNRTNIDNLDNEHITVKKTIELLDRAFTKAHQSYQGSRALLYPVLLFDGEDDHNYNLFTFLKDGKAYVSANVNRTVKPLEQKIAFYFFIKNIPVAPEETIKRTFLNVIVSCIDEHLQAVENIMVAQFLHELCHSSTLDALPHLLYKNPEFGAYNEAHTNSMAVLNSETPLETGFFLCSAYHSAHLPELMQDLEQEGVKWTNPNIRKKAHLIFFLDRMHKHLSPDYNH